MRVRIEFDTDEDGMPESMFDAVKFSTGICDNADSWADAMLLILKTAYYRRSAIIAQMCVTAAGFDERWGMSDIEAIRTALDALVAENKVVQTLPKP